MNCPFCRIVDGRASAEKLWEDEHVLAFRDLAPQAPVHVLVIPKRHVPSIHDLGRDDGELLAALFEAARTVAEAEGLAGKGYRIVTNVGRDGGQSVSHLHLHLLGGRAMHWPPG